jgi:hypothetical protein
VVEATAFLARIVAKYRIEPPADKAEEWKLRPGESEVDRRERIYKVSGRCLVGKEAEGALTLRLGFTAEPRHHADGADAAEYCAGAARVRMEGEWRWGGNARPLAGGCVCVTVV